MTDLAFTLRGPRPSEADLDACEARLGVPIPPAYRRFLAEVCNGGAPARAVAFPVPTRDGGDDEPDLHGLLGVGHPLRYYDIEDAWATFREAFRDQVLPFGFDTASGQVCLHLRRDPPGAVSYWDWRTQDPDDPLASLHPVAPDLDAFLALLRPSLDW